MKSNGERHPEEILAHMEHTRAEMDDTLHAIERRLTPGQLVDQGMHYLRNSGGREFVSNLGASVRDNPIPVTLVGVGLAWLMMRGNAPRERPTETGESLAGRASDMAASARERTSETVGSMRHKASETAGSLRNKASQTLSSVRGRYDAARSRAGELGQSARTQMERARSGYDRMVSEQPLALGAIGLAIGAVIAAAAPRTRQEDEWMGPASDRVTRKARELAEEGLGAAQHAATTAVAGTKEALQSESRTRSTNEPERGTSPVEPGNPIYPAG
jgi:ElaB/YqjD/DUF883 family membrane-anchored ribosome-binding protein